MCTSAPSLSPKTGKQRHIRNMKQLQQSESLTEPPRLLQLEMELVPQVFQVPHSS
jgi:hypothetical protein